MDNDELQIWVADKRRALQPYLEQDEHICPFVLIEWLDELDSEPDSEPEGQDGA